MAWEVEYTNEFREWWDSLSDQEQDDVADVVDLLVERGRHLSHPYSSQIRSSRHGNMRELRIQSMGDPLRVFYAFDPRRTAILLIGGNKTGNNRFYRQYVPRADRLYDQYLEELRREGLIS